LPGYFDFVFHYHTFEDETGQKQRALITQPTDKIVAKDRSGKLSDMEKPNLNDIANKVRGNHV
jgi:hypothetical protein